MRIRYLSGSLAGLEEEVEHLAGEQMCQFGYAELVVAPSPDEAPVETPAPAAEPDPEPAVPSSAETITTGAPAVDP